MRRLFQEVFGRIQSSAESRSTSIEAPVNAPPGLPSPAPFARLRLIEFLLFLPALLLASCAQQAHWDATRLRKHALEYYNKQTMDNLVRASQGLPILHVNVAALNANVQAQAEASIEGGRTGENSSVGEISAAGIVRTVTNTVTRPLSGRLAGSVTDTVDFQTAPVVDDISYYAPYLQFLNLRSPHQRLNSRASYSYNVKRSPTSLVEHLDKRKLEPGKDYVVGTLYRWEGRTFYVPYDYRQAYFDLNLALTSSISWQRNSDSAPAQPVPLADEEGGDAGPSRLPQPSATKQRNRIEQSLQRILPYIQRIR
jgi:hypothetical protein